MSLLKDCINVSTSNGRCPMQSGKKKETEKNREKERNNKIVKDEERRKQFERRERAKGMKVENSEWKGMDMEREREDDHSRNGWWTAAPIWRSEAPATWSSFFGGDGRPSPTNDCQEPLNIASAVWKGCCNVERAYCREERREVDMRGGSYGGKE